MKLRCTFLFLVLIAICCNFGCQILKDPDTGQQYLGFGPETKELGDNVSDATQETATAWSGVLPEPWSAWLGTFAVLGASLWKNIRDVKLLKRTQAGSKIAGSVIRDELKYSENWGRVAKKIEDRIATSSVADPIMPDKVN